MPKQNSFFETFLKVDLFRQPFHFMLPDENRFYRSFLGATLTLVSLISLLAFLTYRVVSMTQLIQYTIYDTNHLFHYEATDAFLPEDGFAVAAGITAYDGKNLTDYKEDEQIGTLKFYRKHF